LKLDLRHWLSAAFRPLAGAANKATRPGPGLALAAICLSAGLGWGQYVEGWIGVPGAWVGSLAYNSREDVLYGASEDGPFFTIRCSDNRSIAWFSLGHAYCICYDSLDNKAYCTFTGSSADSLAVIDGRTHFRIKALPMEGSSEPVWDPVSNRVYVSCQTTGQVAVVDCTTDSLLMYIPVGWCPMKMYINTLRRKLYVLNYDDGTVSVVDMATNQVIKSVEVGGTPNSGYYCRRVDKFYSDGSYGTVAVIDGLSDSVVTRILLPDNGWAHSMAGDELTATVVLGVDSYVYSRVYFVHAPSDSVISTQPTGREPSAVLVNPTSGLVYSANAMSNNVSVMTGNGSQVVNTLPVGDYPFVLKAVPRHDRIYVGHVSTGRVYVIRDTVRRRPDGQPAVPDTATGLRLEPNPFLSCLRITCGPDVAARRVAIWSDEGRLVRVLTQARQGNGALRLAWDGRDSRGRQVCSGVYFVASDRGVRAKVVKLE